MRMRSPATIPLSMLAFDMCSACQWRNMRISGTLVNTRLSILLAHIHVDNVDALEQLLVQEGGGSRIGITVFGGASGLDTGLHGV
jgi:hypothetical protein